MPWRLTEEQWHADLTSWLSLMRFCLGAGGASDRKMRLFTAACLRRLTPVLGQSGGRTIDLLERLADDRVSGMALNEVRGGRPLGGVTFGEKAIHWALVTGSHVKDALVRALENASRAANQHALLRGDARHWPDLFRDLVGNPFRPVKFEDSWRTPAVNAVARAAYDERDLPVGIHLHGPAGALRAANLAVLSDALEEAGCAEEAILSHLRMPGPHVRGCWALDLCLARS
jgi:hypothetical protein